jgi:cytochrome c
MVAVMLGLAGCGEDPKPPEHLRILGSDAVRGRALMARYGCGSCHEIPGIGGANGVVGPSLADYAQRPLLAGIVPNVPRTLVPWLMDPASIDPRTAMPKMGVNAGEARDMATYLYTLGAEGAQVWPSGILPYGRNGEPRALAARLQGLSDEERAMVEQAMEEVAGQASSP